MVQNAAGALTPTNSIRAVEGNLLYKPHMDYLYSSLVRCATAFQPIALEEQLKIQKSATKTAYVYNWLFKSERLRRIRMTYFDAGRSCQAFNALLYPHCRFDLPLLGIDLLSFGSNKILCVVDLVPLSQHHDKRILQLAPLRQPFSRFCSEMSDRFFDQDRFVSEQVIFFRSNLGYGEPQLQVPDGGMYVVYTDYVRTYLDMLNLMEPEEDPYLISCVQSQQSSYDAYLAQRDPAFRVFSSYFGTEWTQKFCSEFLCPNYTWL